ncbi:MAG: hypothetical protein LBQ37_00565 [Elusimicrobiota bacterium]|nr:hypothetical protein [Elusimicrobiota bacterium]
MIEKKLKILKDYVKKGKVPFVLKRHNERKWIRESDKKKVKEIIENVEVTLPYLRMKAEAAKELTRSLAYERYKNTAGETEARNAEKRMRIKKSERLEKMLADTEDVAREDQIVLGEAAKGLKKAMSASESYNQAGVGISKKEIDALFKADEGDKKTYEESLEKAFNRSGGNPKIQMGSTPFILQALGLENLPVVTDKQIILKAAGYLENYKHEHNVKIDDIKNILDYMYDPLAVLKTTQNRFVLVLDTLDNSNRRVILAINKEGGEYHFVPAVYGKDDFERYMRVEAERGNVVYVKDESPEVSGKLQLPPHDGLQGSGNNIQTKADIVKTNNISLQTGKDGGAKPGQIERAFNHLIRQLSKTGLARNVYFLAEQELKEKLNKLVKDKASVEKFVKKTDADVRSIPFALAFVEKFNGVLFELGKFDTVDELLAFAQEEYEKLGDYDNYAINVEGFDYDRQYEILKEMADDGDPAAKQTLDALSKPGAKEKEKEMLVRHMNAERRENFERWQKVLANENPFVRVMVMRELIQGVYKTSDKLPMRYNKTPYEAAMERIEKNPKGKLNFVNTYNDEVNKWAKEGQEQMVLDTGTWYRIKSRTNDPDNYKENVERLRGISAQAWCTRNYKSAQMLSEGDFWIFVDKKGKTKICLRFNDFGKGKYTTGKKIGQPHENVLVEIQDEFNMGHIPTEYTDEILALYTDYLGNPPAEMHGRWANVQLPDILKISKDRQVGAEVWRTAKTTEDKLKGLGIGYVKNDNGKYEILGTELFEKLKGVKENVDGIFADIETVTAGADDDIFFKGINITSLGALKTITAGNVYIESEAALTSLGELETVNGNLSIRDKAISSLGNLKTVTGTLYLNGAKQIRTLEKIEFLGGLHAMSSGLKSLGNLSTIERNCDISYTNLHHLGNLQVVGGALDISGTDIRSLMNVKSVGGKLEVNNKVFNDLGVVKEIGGALDLRKNKNLTSLGKNLEKVGTIKLEGSDITSLGGLTTVMGDLDLRHTKVDDLGKLTKIGGSAFFEDSQVEDLDQLETIGGTALFENSPVKRLGALTKIGNDARFKNSNIESLGKLENIRWNVYFSGSKIKDLGELKTIGGIAMFRGSNIESLGKLEHIQGTAYFDQTGQEKLKEEYEKIKNNKPQKMELQGKLKGFVSGRDVYLNKDDMNLNTPIHEFGHLWVDFVKENNPELYKKGVSLAKETKLFDEIKNNPDYAGLTDDEIAAEVLATAIGNKGESLFAKEDAGTFGKIKAWLKEFWEFIRENLGIRNLSVEQIQNLTYEKFVDMATADLLGGEAIGGEDISKPLTAQDVENPESLKKITLITNIETLRNTAGYDEGKAGNMKAAQLLIRNLMSKPKRQKRVDELIERNPGAIVVGVHAEEANGINYIPSMFADYIEARAKGLGKETGKNYNITADDKITQANKVSRTEKNRKERTDSVPTFKGKVVKGGKYILTDDAAAMGTTLSTLRYYVESNGGEVVDVITLAAGRNGPQLTPDPKKVVDFDKQLKVEFGISLRQLLREAGYYGGQEKYLTNGELQEFEKQAVDAGRAGGVDGKQTTITRILQESLRRHRKSRTETQNETDKPPETYNQPVGDGNNTNDNTEKEARGSVEFDDTFKAIITLTKNKDKSTIIHEFGHIYLQNIYQLSLISEDKNFLELKSRVDVWLGVKEGQGKYTKEQHEKFANAFVAYVKTGEAPNSALRRMFDLFRNWLRDIRDTLVSRAEKDLTPEIKSVFDELLAPSAAETLQLSEEGLSKVKEVIETIESGEGLLIEDDIETARRWLSIIYARRPKEEQAAAAFDEQLRQVKEMFGGDIQRAQFSGIMKMKPGQAKLTFEILQNLHFQVEYSKNNFRLCSKIIKGI